MCLLCVANPAGQERAQRAHVLRLLALIEHSDALPADAALRVAGELLARMAPAGPRCEAVAPARPVARRARRQEMEK